MQIKLTDKPNNYITAKARASFYGVTWLGIVSDDAGRSGALGQINGVYRIYCDADNSYPLDADAVAQAMPTATVSTSPRALYGRRMINYSVALDGDSWDILKSYGDGNLSAGIRKAAQLVEMCSPQVVNPACQK